VQEILKLFYDVKVMTCNLHDHIIEKKRKFFKSKRKLKERRENGFRQYNWKGDKYVSSQGYILCYEPNHPRANRAHRVPEHILVAESKIGRSLNRKEVVHHIDFDKQNNLEENLCVMTEKEHNLLHQTTLKRLFQEGKLIWKKGSYEVGNLIFNFLYFIINFQPNNFPTNSNLNKSFSL
jgi:hypothetical protein